MKKTLLPIALLATGLLALLSVQHNPRSQSGEEPAPVLTPAEEAATFRLEPGLRAQLVAAEPMVEDPVAMSFDADGKLWVVEMRGFMPTVDGTGEDKPVGRISVLTDTNGDGQMDKSVVYLDSLVMPRAMAFAPGGVLVAENNALWMTRDRNGDGKADEKTVVDANYMGGGPPEHAPNGLWRGLDNWYYSAKARVRYKFASGSWQRDSTEFRGQWGISHDDNGRLYYNYNWSQLHADLVPPNYLSRNPHHKPTTGIDYGVTLDRRVYPIHPTPAVNRGYIPGTLDKTGRLQEFTAACSPFFYRGNALPTAFYGNTFVCEPAGNLIKRNIVEEKNLLLTAHDPHPGTEFLASTDVRFRPVSLAEGPDGALYITDMYRGLIQHEAYLTPYLKEQTLQRGLEKPVHRGRIWRIVPEKEQAVRPAPLSTASTADLIRALGSADGWQRDMAQRLLVEKNDRSAETGLTALATGSSDGRGRMQALWTLNGLGLSKPDRLFALLGDSSTLVSTTALRLLEPFARTDKALRAKLGTYLLANWEKAPMPLVLQLTLSANVLEPSTTQKLLAQVIGNYGESALLRDAALSSLTNQEFALLQRLLNDPQWQAGGPAKEIFTEMLTSCVINKRNPVELSALLTRLNDHQTALNPLEKSVLTGLTIAGGQTKTKPIRLASAPALLTRTGTGIDAPKLASLNAMFEWPGHTAVRNTAMVQSKLNEAEQKQFAAGRMLYLNTCSGCHGTDGVGLARFAPPLVGSDWVTGDSKRLVLILLHGLEGPVEVNKKLYDAPDILPVMPAHSTVDDASLTAILTYIRNEWGNNAGPLDKGIVGKTRVTSQGRVVPWTAKELNKYMTGVATTDVK